MPQRIASRAGALPAVMMMDAGYWSGNNVASLSDAIGCRGLLVHAESEQARSFYEHLIAEFDRSPADPLHLLLRLKDIRRTLGR